MWYNSTNMHPEEKTAVKFHQASVHEVLAHSYTFYFFALLIGLLLDFIFPIKLLNYSLMVPIGSIFIVLGSLLILWAQKTSRHLPEENLNKQAFCHGPYCITRSPTHWGLTFMMLGFGIIANATFIIVFTIFAFIITKLIFLKKEESILAQKYGSPYLEYKKSVRL